ncbi:MAG: LysR family transcriptional regulator [Alphaproteobacteria bacterium]|nr:LysR family transcriptional regulator [Alphaproteobacteria bacterium]MDE2011772.1 LysR family transcriptional regulator [Alphaproteobacteria bacterium]MDE2073826.1 LysR family transcriptional regulator [Alphaproteobacteria bacterium]MDE2351947.1 LysR family transcriptional regulator [Alphaproteobacteria bacterium]
MMRLTIRVDFPAGGAFGPGKARLLELIDELKSIRRAAVAMDMSYRQAWLLVQGAEEIFGGPIVETAIGGTHGGGSTLTALGRELVARYRAIEAKATKAAGPEMAALAKLAGGRAPSQHRRSLRGRKGRAAAK